MTRSLSTGMSNAVTASIVRPLLLAQLDFASQTVYLTNGLRDVSWDSQTWQAYGAFLGLQGGEESSDGRASQATLTLSGVLSSYVALAYSDEYQGRNARVWLAARDDSGNIIADPVPFIFGMMDSMADSDDGEKATIALTIVTQATDQRRSREWRLTDQHQQELFPGDKGLEFVAGLSQKKIKFGG